MRKIHKITAALLSLAMVMAPAALAGCNPDTPPDDKPIVQPEVVKVTGVTLSAAGNAQTVTVGATLQLTATVSPANATNKSVTYSSGDDGIATVSAGGLVTGVSAGRVTITVTTADGNKTDSLALTVEAREVAVTGVQISPADVLFVGALKVGETVALKADATPSDATDKSVAWTSGNAEVATVENGTVTAVSAGAATIKATANDGSGVYGEYPVKVFAEKTVLTGENAELRGDLYYNTDEHCIGAISAGNSATFKITSETAQTVTLVLNIAVTSAVDASFAKHFTLTVGGNEVSPDGDAVACGTDYGWANPGVCIFSDVELSAGDTAITFTAASGVNTNINSLTLFSQSAVTEKVQEEVTPITGTDHIFKGSEAVRTAGAFGAISVGSDGTLGNINNNNGATLTYKVEAADACTAGLYCNLAFGNSSVSGIFTLTVNGEEVSIPNTFTQEGANWTTYNEFWLANVDLIKGINTIVFTVTGGCGNYDYMTLKSGTDITAASLVSDIQVIVAKELLAVGDTTTLNVTVAGPAENIAYTSGNPAVATVSDDGTVTAVAEGKTTITVRSTDGSDISRTVNIFVASGTGTVYEAESAKLTNVTVEAANGNYVGGLNNAGAKVTFENVSSAEGGKALLRVYTAVANGSKLSIDYYYKITVNGTEIDLSGGQFAYNGVAPNWNTDNGYFTVEIELTAVNNVIELISVGTDVQTNLDKIVIYG